MVIGEKLVRKLAEAYVRGESELRFEGTSYRIGSECFHVYEISMNFGSDVDRILAYLHEYASKNCAGNFYERVFSDNCKNVTNDFLRGREWGEIVDLYNIYINDGDSKPILTALTRDEVVKFERDFAEGVNPIWVDGRSLQLKGPKRIKIFDIELEYLHKNKGEVKSQIKKWVQLVQSGRWDVSALEHFGKEVTDQFNVRAFGGHSGGLSSTVTDWNLIHPLITQQAKQRYLAQQYADSVEASFKELNDIVKGVYLKETGIEDDGASLMRNAFAHKKPVFFLADNSTTSGRSVQEGYMNIFAGVIIGIRNPKAHANVNISSQDAWEKIVIASHLLKIWDNRLK